jgi:hypothetical protein
METNNITLLYGGAAKPSYLMSPEEYKDAAQRVVNRAKEKAFSRGLPIYYNKNNLAIAEFADGRKFVVENRELVRPYLEDGE